MRFLGILYYADQWHSLATPGDRPRSNNLWSLIIRLLLVINKNSCIWIWWTVVIKKKRIMWKQSPWESILMGCCVHIHLVCSAIAKLVCPLLGWLVSSCKATDPQLSTDIYMFEQLYTNKPKCNLSTGIVCNLWSETVSQMLCGKIWFYGVWSSSKGYISIGGRGSDWHESRELHWKRVRYSGIRHWSGLQRK